VHEAGIQDRDGAPCVLASIRSRYPWLRHIFADGGYAGDKLRKALILSLEEIARLLEAAPRPKYKAALSAAYGAGLRVSAVVTLKVSDIDSERMLLRIEGRKGRKDRFAMLS
jgi:integrase